MAQVHNYRTGKMVTIQVGDVVGFKSDFEQYGRVTKIDGERLTLENPDKRGADVSRRGRCRCWQL